MSRAAADSRFRFEEVARREDVADPNAGMGIAAADFGDGMIDLFVTNSRGRLRGVPQPGFVRRATVIRGRTARVRRRGHAARRLGGVVGRPRPRRRPRSRASERRHPGHQRREGCPTHAGDRGERLERSGACFAALGSASGSKMQRVNSRGLAEARGLRQRRRPRYRDQLHRRPADPPREPGTEPTRWLEVQPADFAPGAVTVTLRDRAHARARGARWEQLPLVRGSRVHFGLGDTAVVERLTIRFPDGTTEHLGRTSRPTRSWRSGRQTQRPERSSACGRWCRA